MFGSFYFGYVTGVAPLVAYNYGKQNFYRTKKLFRKSLIILSVLSVITVVMTLGLATQVVNIFIDPYMSVYLGDGFYYDMSMQPLRDMSTRGLRIVSLAFVFMGFNVYASGMLTGFNDGLMSGLLMLFRTFVFTLVLILVLPIRMGIDGVWTALPLAEGLAFIVSVGLVIFLGKKYKYLDGVKYTSHNGGSEIAE